MLLDTTMQNADNFDPGFFCVSVINYMLANAVFEIAFPDAIACMANLGLVPIACIISDNPPVYAIPSRSFLQHGLNRFYGVFVPE